MPPSTPRLEYSPHKRARVVQAYDLGMKVKDIALKEGISPGSVWGIQKRYRNQERGRNKRRVGRPKIISERDIRHVKRIIDIDPFISNENLLRAAALSCSISTLNRVLVKEGIQHHRALRRPKLTTELAAKRLTFAQRYLEKPVDWWKNWIFTDETTIARGDGQANKWVFCSKVCPLPPNIIQVLTAFKSERLDPKFVQPRTKPTRHSKMFWAAFSFNDRSELRALDGDPESRHGGITGRIILTTLQEEMPKICGPGSIFAQDNAPTHTCILVQDWLIPWAEEHGVELVD